jgi:integrase
VERAGRRKGWRKHEGVAIIRRELPSGGVRWLVRYESPDTKKMKHKTIPTEHNGTEEQRLAFAASEMRKNGARVKQLEEGAPIKKNLTLEAAVERYFANAGPGLREKTLRCYRQSSAAMLAWWDARGFDLTDDIRSEHLADLRAWIANKKMKRPDLGEGRAARRELSTVRSAAAINRELREVKVILEALRRLGLVGDLRKDAISDNLKPVKAPRPLPKPLKVAELRRLVDAAKRHDADCFAKTEAARKQGFTRGATPIALPVLPYLATVLLSGMRADEARLLKWTRVDLRAEPNGIVALEPEDVKTKHARQIDLTVSPLLRRLLSRLRLKAGDSVHVFGDQEDEETGAIEPKLTYEGLKAARKRLMREYGAPSFSWQRLRQTAGTFLTNAPGIFGAASAYRSAKQLGHSVTVAEKHYLGVVHVDPMAKTLEKAMGIRKRLREALGLQISVRSPQRHHGRGKKRNSRSSQSSS